MKNIRYLFLCGLLISLTACNQAITRFWNGDGHYPPPAYRKASEDCSQEYLKINPGPPAPITRNQEWLKYNAEAEKWISQCIHNKGLSK